MQRTRVTLLQCLLYAITGLAAMSGMRASAATLCVNQNPKSGCPYTTIGAAVAAAAVRGHDQRRPRPLCRRRAYHPTGFADRRGCTMDDHQRQRPVERHLHRRHQRQPNHPRQQHADQCDGQRVYRAERQFREDPGAQRLERHLWGNQVERNNLALSTIGTCPGSPLSRRTRARIAAKASISSASIIRQSPTIPYRTTLAVFCSAMIPDRPRQRDPGKRGARQRL